MTTTNRASLLEAATKDPLAHSFANGPQAVREQLDMGISASMKKGRTRSTREGLLRAREPSNRIGGETSALGPSAVDYTAILKLGRPTGGDAYAGVSSTMRPSLQSYLATKKAFTVAAS
jgi:hypothetical protein